jgi:Spy/CpxP family protein refolding chaperone
MKNFFIYSIIFLSVTTFAGYAQDGQSDEGDGQKRPQIKKIEQLEKSKLIEILNLDDATAVKFFVRKKEHRKNEHNLFEQREELAKKIEKKFQDNVNQSSKEYKEQLNELLALDQKIVDERKNYFNSLNDILTPEQILKLAVFENRFMREIHDILAGKKHGRQN